MVKLVENLKDYKVATQLPQTPYWLLHFWLLKPEQPVRDLPEWCNRVTGGLQSQQHKLNTFATVLERGA